MKLISNKKYAYYKSIEKQLTEIKHELFIANEVIEKLKYDCEKNKLKKEKCKINNHNLRDKKGRFKSKLDDNISTIDLYINGSNILHDDSNYKYGYDYVCKLINEQAIGKFKTIKLIVKNK